MTASKLSPPTLHWGTVVPSGDQCDLCSATIKPHGDCFISIRRSFELIRGAMIETEPIKVLMCVDCGWTRPYAPTPRSKPSVDAEGQNPPQKPASAQDEALGDVEPDYYSSDIMDDGDRG